MSPKQPQPLSDHIATPNNIPHDNSATSSSTPACPSVAPAAIAVGANTAPAAPPQPIHTHPDANNAYNVNNACNVSNAYNANNAYTTQTSTQTSFTLRTPPSTTNTPAHRLTSSSLSLLRDTTASYNPLEYYLSAPSTDGPWNAEAYHTSHGRD